MKLYFLPGACSLSPRIALGEAGLSFETVPVERGTRNLPDGSSYLSINPKGQVPALQLDDGSVLTEGPAIVQYIADQVPALGLAPALGTPERYRLMEILNYLTSEVHKSFSPIFNPMMVEEAKPVFRKLLGMRFDYLAQRLGKQAYLMGEKFTVADGYLFVMLGWTKHPAVGIDLSQWPVLQEYAGRIAARPAVVAAMKAEGLIPA